MRNVRTTLPAAFVCAMLFQAVQAGTAVPSGDAVLGRLKKEHPRLLLTKEKVQRLKDLAGRDNTLRKCISDARSDADRYVNQPLPRYRKGGMLAVSRECCERAYALGAAWLFTGDERYAQALERLALTVCDFPDWNPGHFLDTAEMTNAAGIAYDWLYGRLSSESRDRVREGIIRNGLKPGEKGGWWVGTEINWNMVCHGGLIIGSLAIADEEPGYAARLVPRAVANLPEALSTYAPDGVWPEGMGYWRYATNYSAIALSALQTALGTDFGLGRMEGISNAGYFPLYASGPTGLVLNFADTSRRSGRTNIPEFFWLAGAFNKPLFARIESYSLRTRRARSLHVIFYPDKALTGSMEPLTLDRHLGGSVPIATFRSSWDDRDALFIGVKGGFNWCNHGHLDAGNFELDAMGVRWARDLGSDSYGLPGFYDDKEGGKRWSYFRNSSRGHNVPLFDNHNQRVKARAGLIEFCTLPRGGYAIVDLSQPYSEYTKGAFRGVALVKNRTAALVQDEFNVSRSAEITWGMTTDAVISANGNKAVLELGGRTLRAVILSPPNAEFNVESAEQEPPQNRNRGIRRLVSRVNAVPGRVTFCVAFFPEWSPGTSLQSGELVALPQWKSSLFGPGAEEEAANPRTAYAPPEPVDFETLPERTLVDLPAVIEEVRNTASNAGYEKAAEVARARIAGAGNSEAGAVLEPLARGFEAYGYLRQIVIERTGEKDPTVIVDFGGPQKAKIISAGEENFKAAIMGTGVDLPWSSLSARRFFDLAAAYVRDDYEEKALLLHFSAAAGLAERARELLLEIRSEAPPSASGPGPLERLIEMSHEGSLDS